MQRAVFISAAIALVCGTSQIGTAAEPKLEPIAIGSRLELFVDEHMIQSLSGDAKLYLHKPEPREVVLVTDEPWEGSTCAYNNVFQDGDLFRLYYRGAYSYDDKQALKQRRREITCYIESKDGIHWTKPDLGLFEYQSSKENNIVWDGPGTHNFTSFKCANPDAPDEARYKALGRGRGGLLAFKSPDAIHWSLMADKAVITHGAFDSQNLAFWDSVRGEYRAYWRIFKSGVRDIRTATSKDFINWGPWTDLDYGNAPKEHLYTNAILPYERAPHIFIGFPARFLPRTQQVEPIFMASRDGHTFRRWTEALIPLDAPQDRAGNRSNYMAWGLVQLPDNDREYSVYASEAYGKYGGPYSRLRRFTYRVDGFVSVRASGEGGELVTKPLTFSGSKLAINFATSVQGSVRVEIQEVEGEPIDGFTLDACDELRGDAIEQVVAWKSDADLGAIAGKPVRLRFALNNADLFSFRFVE